MVAVPFAAFYPYSPSQLKDLGFDRVASWMSIGQVSEVMALLLIGRIQFRWKVSLDRFGRHWIRCTALPALLDEFIDLRGSRYRLPRLGVYIHAHQFTSLYLQNESTRNGEPELKLF